MQKDINLVCSFCGKSQAEVKRLISSPTGDSFICDECIDVCREIINDGKTKEKKATAKIDLPFPHQIKEMLDGYIVGQDEAKKALSVAVYNHYKRINYNAELKEKNIDETPIELEKSNVLMIGPTGCGKTLLAKTLAKILKVPFASADATTLTEAGYVGEDVENILLKLIQNADYDIAKAERGIVYIDEIDKISRKGENRSITRDVSGEGVQQALLKILESTVASVPPQGGRKHPQQEMLQIDTTNILFICGGAFVGLDKIIEKRISDSTLGFGSGVKSKEEKDSYEYIQNIQPQDMIKFGLIPEFVGRLPIVVGLHELNEPALVQILTTPKNSITKQYAKMFDMDGIKLEFEDSCLSAVAQKAIKLKTGARGLRTILEDSMIGLMYTAPEDKTIDKIVLTDKFITDGESPVYIRKEIKETPMADEGIKILDNNLKQTGVIN